MYAIVLAGGVGTRLWPRSRQARPKQFSDITGRGRTMLQSTVERLNGVVAEDEVYVITGEQHAELARQQVSQLPYENVIAEPCGRNTAPAIGFACMHLQQRGINDVIAILPADHTIDNVERFQVALRRAYEAAEAGYIVTLGIEPYAPHTGYGYIKRGQDTLLGEDGGTLQSDLPIYNVENFLEKPDMRTATRFLEEGGYYWNGGIFVSRVDRMLDEYARQMPQLYQQLGEIVEVSKRAKGDTQTIGHLWAALPDISIDYAIIEGADRVAVVPLQAGWNDAGSWDALDQVLGSDETSNVQVSGDMLLLESKGNIVYGDNRFMALVGVSDLVVVDTDDALLIGHKSEIQRVKHVVEYLRQRNRQELL